jgi:polar amino acid transport system permease protein
MTTPGPTKQLDIGPSGVARERGSKLLGRHAFLVSTASTLAFLGVIALIVYLAPGSRLVAERFFSWTHIKQAITGTPNTPSVVAAFWLNIKMFVIAEVIILVFALVIALVRGLPGPAFFPLRALAVVYTDFFRGVPVILVLYMIGFGVPGLGLTYFSGLSDVTFGIISLVLVYSAYVAEVYRAGIDSVHESQTAAARSLGLSRWQATRFVVLPQAIRRVIPPLLNDFIGLQKDTALVSVLGSIEAARAAQIYASFEFNYASYVVAAVLFVLMTIPLARFTDRLIERDRRRMRAGAVA